jgi:hypothetical protein
VKVTDLLGAPERRHVAPMEVRTASVDELVLTGYASVFNHPYDVMGGPTRGGFAEIVDPKAFDKTLTAAPDRPHEVGDAATVHRQDGADGPRVTGSRRPGRAAPRAEDDPR